jgi:hypothetical protein
MASAVASVMVAISLCSNAFSTWVIGLLMRRRQPAGGNNVG